MTMTHSAKGFRFYTVGHGNRELDDLRGQLADQAIVVLVDIRSRPRSRHNPQFDEPALRAACDESGITYHWAGRALGGLRRTHPDSPHTALPEGLRGFADHADTPAVSRAIEQLEGLARDGPVVLLCAERDPMHCHRSLVADRLLLSGHRVDHLVGIDASVTHALRPEARKIGDRVIYDRGATSPLPLH